MSSKINGSFKEELKTTPVFVKSIRNQLKRKARNAKIIWVVFLTLISLINICIIAIASVALKQSLDAHQNNNLPWSAILPTTLVAALSIFIFILSIIITLYKGFMKARTYTTAAHDIQYLTIFYNSKKNNLNETQFKNKINDIVKNANKKRNKIGFKKTLISILTGGNNE